MTSADEQKGERDRQFEREALCWLPQVTRYALSLSRDESNAEDLVQETFLRAYRSWGSYTPGTECRAWFFTICRNVFLRGEEHARRETPADDADLEALAAAAVHASAVEGGQADVFDTVDLSDAIGRALAELPEAFRHAVILVDVQDESYDTASRVLGVPVGTVRSRLFRGRRLLQESLLEYARDAGFARFGDSAGEGETN
jgi:RNA polymerase sigma-70 factor (ECF subfamily)